MLCDAVMHMLHPDPKKFPNGMKSVSDRIHDMGLKFGMYSSAGEMTCARFGTYAADYLSSRMSDSRRD